MNTKQYKLVFNDADMQTEVDGIPCILRFRADKRELEVVTDGPVNDLALAAEAVQMIMSSVTSIHENETTN